MSTDIAPDSVMRRHRPDFFCLGVQKAGTTWLFENLRTHPGICPPLFKEPHYFDTLYCWDPSWGTQEAWDMLPLYSRIAETVYWKLVVEKAPASEETVDYLREIAGLYSEPFTDDWYSRFFSHCAEHELCGDFTPDNCLVNDHGVAHMQRANPNAKYILLFRDPVERDWAHLRMILPKTAPDEDYLKATRKSDFMRRSDYQAIINKWKAAVGSDRLLIGFYDEIVASPRKLLDRVAEFLKLGRSDWPQAEQVSLKGREQPIPPRVYRRLATMSLSTLEFMANDYPTPCAGWLEKHLAVATGNNPHG